MKIADRQIQIRKNLIRSLVTMLTSLGGGIAVLAYMRFGPEAQDKAVLFLGFLLAVFGALFLVSLFTFAVPLLEMFVFIRIFPETTDPVDRFLMEDTDNYIEWDVGSQQFIAWSKSVKESKLGLDLADYDISGAGKTASDAALQCMERCLERNPNLLHGLSDQ